MLWIVTLSTVAGGGLYSALVLAFGAVEATCLVYYVAVNVPGVVTVEVLGVADWAHWHELEGCEKRPDDVK